MWKVIFNAHWHLLFQCALYQRDIHSVTWYGSSKVPLSALQTHLFFIYYLIWLTANSGLIKTHGQTDTIWENIKLSHKVQAGKAYVADIQNCLAPLWCSSFVAINDNYLLIKKKLNFCFKLGNSLVASVCWIFPADTILHRTKKQNTLNKWINRYCHFYLSDKTNCDRKLVYLLCNWIWYRFKLYTVIHITWQHKYTAKNEQIHLQYFLATVIVYN